MIEALVDRAARQLGIDRVTLRRRNLIRRFPHRNAAGPRVRLGRLRALPGPRAGVGRGSAGRPRRGDGDRVRDRRCYVERAGGAWESAEIELGDGGRFVIASSASPHGQGHETTFAQIAAESPAASSRERSSCASATARRRRRESERSAAARWRWPARRSPSPPSELVDAARPSSRRHCSTSTPRRSASTAAAFAADGAGRRSAGRGWPRSPPTRNGARPATRPVGCGRRRALPRATCSPPAPTRPTWRSSAAPGHLTCAGWSPSTTPAR